MKICYLADGESIHTKRWCTHFASRGHDIHLISFKAVTIPGTTVHFIDAGKIDASGGSWKIIFSSRRIKKLVEDIQPDILHSHYATSYGLIGALMNYHPFVVTALGTDVLISPDQSFIYRKILRFVFRRADWITAMADHMKTKMIKMGVDPQKISTVIFGIDTSIFNLEGRTLPVDKFVITSTRNFEPVYNVQHLIESFSEAWKNNPNLYLNLIGSGSLKETLKELVMKKDLTNAVKFLGKIPQEELAEVLKHSHIFATVSLSDGNNISLNEAMGCGALCIATDIPANRQWIEDGENGFLVPVNDVNYLRDKILATYKDYEHLSSKFIPVNSKIISEQADWKKNMATVEEQYLKLAVRK